MIVKLIEVHVRPGLLEAFLERQQVWHEAMTREPGFLGAETALDPHVPDRAWLTIRFASRAALDGFMRGAHDRLDRTTGIAETYEGLQVRVLEVVQAVDRHGHRP